MTLILTLDISTDWQMRALLGWAPPLAVKLQAAVKLNTNMGH